MRRADLTGAERNAAFPVLSGLRPLADMPEWGYEGDPDSPVPEQHIEDLLCHPFETIERPNETTFARVINSCGAEVVPFADAAEEASVSVGSVPVPCVQGKHGDTVGESAAASATVAAGGTGYTLNDVVTVAGGTAATAATFQVTGVTAGVVDAVTLVDAGDYSATPANPAATTGGTGTGLTLNVTYASTAVTALFLPFKIDLPRDMDLCEDLTGAVVARGAARRIREFAELAVLRQLWSSAIEPRSTNLSRNAIHIGDGTPLTPHAAYGDLVERMESEDHIGWTLGMPARAKSILAEQHIIERDGAGWVDVHGQPVIAAGQPKDWTPQHNDSESAAPAAAGAEGYLVAMGPVWFVLGPVEETIRGDQRPGIEELLVSQVSTRPQVRGAVITRTTDVFAVLTDLAG